MKSISKIPLALGTVVPPYGKIGAILLTGGERYYLLSEGRSVAMIPDFIIEEQIADNQLA